MRTWKLACGAAILALGVATAAHADEWNKLTYLTFSGPVNMPGITLPAGTYRFELMDPDNSRRVIRVSNKDGSKNYGIFLSISDQKLEPSDKPVVMFSEMPAGSPQAIRAWFYPGETIGYEFVYPRNQAMKIAAATHQSVLAMNEPKASTTDEDRVASMRSADVGRIDENGKPVSSDERLKESSSQRTTTAPAAASNASTAPSSRSATTTAPSNSSQSNARQTTTAAPQASTSRAQTTTAPSSSADRGRAARNAQSSTAVGTSGTAGARHLPRTASPVPLIALFSTLSLCGALGVRAARKALA